MSDWAVPTVTFAPTLVLPINSHAIHRIFAHVSPFPFFTPILESLCRLENSVASEFIFSTLMAAFRLPVKEISDVYCRKVMMSE